MSVDGRVVGIVGIASIAGALACGGGSAVEDQAAFERDLAATDAPGNMALGGGTITSGASSVPSSWPAEVPSYPSPTYAGEMPGAVAGRPDVSATWTVPDAMPAVADKYTALEGKGWTRDLLLVDAESVLGAWTSGDGKQNVALACSKDFSGSGGTSVTVVVSNRP